MSYQFMKFLNYDPLELFPSFKTLKAHNHLENGLLKNWTSFMDVAISACKNPHLISNENPDIQFEMIFSENFLFVVRLR